MPKRKNDQITLDTFRQLGGRLCHYRDELDNIVEPTKRLNGSVVTPSKIREGSKRVVTIAYWQTDDDMIYYGAAIFRPDKPGETFSRDVRRRNTQTAIDRFFLRAVQVFAPDEDLLDYESTAAFLRQAVRIHGVRSDDLNEDDLLMLMSERSVSVSGV